MDIPEHELLRSRTDIYQIPKQSSEWRLKLQMEEWHAVSGGKLRHGQAYLGGFGVQEHRQAEGRGMEAHSNMP